MNPRVRSVEPLRGYRLRIVFDNNEVRVFSAETYLDRGAFQKLRDPALFDSVQPFLGSIQWANGLDLCPDTLYEDSVPAS